MSHDTDLLFAVGTMRFIPRMWRQFYMKDTANIAEHTNRVIWIAMMLAARTSEKVDIGRLVQLALIHDADEICTGDVTPLSRHYTTRKSDEAVRDLVAETSLSALVTSLHEELSRMDTIEAKLVKDADMLDVDLEMMELAFMGHNFGTNFKDARNKIRKLKTAAGKILLEEIESADVSTWFRRGFKID